MTDTPSASIYPEDLWQYLERFSQLPSRSDRDRLARAAAQARGTKDEHEKWKRLRIWDYFFRIPEEELTRSLRADIAKVAATFQANEKALAERRAKSEARLAELAARDEQVRARAARERDLIAMNSLRSFDSTANARIALGKIALGIAVLLLFALLSQIGEERSSADEMFPLLLIVTIAGVVLVATGGKLRDPAEGERRIRQSQRAIDEWLARALAEPEPELAFLRASMAQQEEAFREAQSRITRAKRDLTDLLAKLRAQLPEPPADEEVARWLDEDLQRLEAEALDRSGLRDRLLPVKNAKVPFCLPGPAELQRPDLIPEPYLGGKSVERLDRAKHLRTRRLVRLRNGEFVGLYGLFYIEILMLGEDAWARHGVFFDFVTGSVVSERTTTLQYANVVRIESSRGYRQVAVGDEVRDIFDLVSLILSLTDGSEVHVTFPNSAYFDLFADAGVEARRYRYDAEESAEMARRCIDNQVDIAQRKREVAGDDPLSPGWGSRGGADGLPLS